MNVKCSNLMEHYLEDIINEFETQKCNIEYHKSLICKYCKDFINYIGPSDKANKQNVWKHYLGNECISCAKLRFFLSEGPFYHESVVIYSYILLHQI